MGYSALACWRRPASLAKGGKRIQVYPKFPSGPAFISFYLCVFLRCVSMFFLARRGRQNTMPFHRVSVFNCVACVQFWGAIWSCTFHVNTHGAGARARELEFAERIHGLMFFEVNHQTGSRRKKADSSESGDLGVEWREGEAVARQSGRHFVLSNL